MVDVGFGLRILGRRPERRGVREMIQNRRAGPWLRVQRAVIASLVLLARRLDGWRFCPNFAPWARLVSRTSWEGLVS